jgi:hypothetical protein
VSAFLCVVLSCVGRGLASGRSPVQGVPPIVYRFTSKIPSTPQGKRGRLRKEKDEQKLHLHYKTLGQERNSACLDCGIGREGDNGSVSMKLNGFSISLGL